MLAVKRCESHGGVWNGAGIGQVAPRNRSTSTTIWLQRAQPASVDNTDGFAPDLPDAATA